MRFTAILICFFPALLLASEPVGKVLALNLAEHLITVESTGSDRGMPGDRVVVKFDDGTQCQLEIVEIAEQEILLSTTGCAQEAKIVEGQAVEAAPDPESLESGIVPAEGAANILHSRHEAWYAYSGIGISSVHYNGSLNKAATQLNATPGLTHTPLNLDIFGLYFPVNEHHTLTGIVFNAVAERWSDMTGSFQINQYLIAFSVMHFFGNDIGQGWFARVDAGAAWYKAQLSIPGMSNSASSRAGFGLLGGGGYAIPINDEARFLLGLYYTHRSAESTNIGTFSLTAGILF